MIRTLGSHSGTALSGVTDGEWVHFDILKAGEEGGDDRYRLLRDLTRPPRSNPFNAPRPTLPPADKVSNLVADGLSQALSSEGIDHSTESRDLEAVEFGEEVTVEDRWVEVDRLPEGAWKTILEQAMDVLRSAVKERATFNETAAELKDTSISSLSELANEYVNFFKSGIVSYNKKKQPTSNNKIQRTLILRVKNWTSGESPGSGSPPESQGERVTFTVRSEEAAQEIFSTVLSNATLLYSEELSFRVLVKGNVLNTITRLENSGLVTSVNVGEEDPTLPGPPGQPTPPGPIDPPPPRLPDLPPRPGPPEEEDPGDGNDGDDQITAGISPLQGVAVAVLSAGVLSTMYGS